MLGVLEGLVDGRCDCVPLCLNVPEDPHARRGLSRAPFKEGEGELFRLGPAVDGMPRTIFRYRKRVWWGCR